MLTAPKKSPRQPRQRVRARGVDRRLIRSSTKHNPSSACRQKRTCTYENSAQLVSCSRDPIGYLDGWNLYQYVGSNPLPVVDPLGLAVSGFSISIGFGPVRWAWYSGTFVYSCPDRSSSINADPGWTGLYSLGGRILGLQLGATYEATHSNNSGSERCTKPDGGCGTKYIVNLHITAKVVVGAGIEAAAAIGSAQLYHECSCE